jgi:long-chain acyl-CoA synthetase
LKSIAEVRAALTAPGRPFEMDQIEVRGERTRVWKNAPTTLREVLELSRGHGDADFLVYEGDRLTFAEHYAHAATFARRLIDGYGVAKGDRVAIAMRNFPEWSVAFFGAALAGAVAVPLNAWWTAAELEYGLTDSGAKVLIADAQRAERLAEALPRLGVPAVVVRPGGSLPAGALPYEQVLGEVDAAAAPPEVAVGPEDDATIFYTSGTTGRPKGALGTHRNITTNPISLAYGMLSAGVRAGGDLEQLMGAQRRVTLLSVPLFHATGCHSVLVSSALNGGTVVLMYKWDADQALALIEREGVTGFGGVPSMAWQVLTSPRFGDYDTSSLTGVSFGGAPAAPTLVDKIKERLPARTPGNGYGLAETAAAFAGGWFHSGDLARLDDDGFVYIVDRAKDMLIRGGENIYCAEVEAALYEHPAVADCGVIGVPHEVLGEEVGAVVRLRPGARLTTGELRAFLGERIAAFKVPAHVWFRDQDLPRNPGGKLLKTRLREELLG